jgi:hypothetical protein
LVVDESLGLSNASTGAMYKVTELYPRQGASLAPLLRHGQSVEVEVGGSDARVLRLTKAHQPADPAASASVQALPAALPPIHCAMPISPTFVPSSSNTGGRFATSFTIPAAIGAQLKARAAAYPVQWTARDRIATWLDPNRLLGSIFISNPTDNLLDQIALTVDGAPVQVKRSYNSRGLNHSRTFLGYYFDASAISQGHPHSLVLTLPTTLRPGAFTGIFWQNVENEY